MKINYSLGIYLICLFFTVFSNSTFGTNSWTNTSYSPNLRLLPYYGFTSNLILADCSPPSAISITDVTAYQATVGWIDTSLNDTWELFVQDFGGPGPIGSGNIVKSKSAVINKTSGSATPNLQPNTVYVVYVRSICTTNNSDWIGPIEFTTLCLPVSLPFWEGFNVTSELFDCWRIVDANNDAPTPNGNNIWKKNTTNYEGGQSMTLNGVVPQNNLTPHDDWLISPSFVLDSKKVYRLRYHYRTNDNVNNEYRFGVLLSNKGIDVESFTTTIVPYTNFNASSEWFEEKRFITGIDGIVNIAWHATSLSAYSYMYIDNVFFEEVNGCPEPVELGVKDIDVDAFTIFWRDDFNGEWEYIAQKVGGVFPSKAGFKSNSKEVVITQDKNGDPLEFSTDYEYYVRAKCKDGGFSDWAGPFKLKTACGVYSTPFWEGFNFNSASHSCWKIIDSNKDAVTPTSSNIWKSIITNYEGTGSMFYGGAQIDASKRPHNDWLVSPLIQLKKGVKYRLKYHYRTAAVAANNNEFAVYMATSGDREAIDFKTVLIPKAVYEPSNDWNEEYVLFDGVDAMVSIGWHVTSSSANTTWYIDNVFVEEVSGCIEPLPSSMGVKGITASSATIYWDDKFGSTSWEYIVQEEGGKVPLTPGTKTSSKENVVSTVNSGAALKPNTAYEYYVRTICGVGKTSIWQGPYYFNTACAVFAIPFLEGFNSIDKSVNCWMMVDNNKDRDIANGNNAWRIYNTATLVFEGDQSMYFNGTAGRVQDDWLISPTIKMETGNYVLKYHYKATANNNNEFEVLLSSNGTDLSNFTTTVIPSKTYKNGTYVEEVNFFNGTVGEINLAWHVKSNGQSSITLDKISLKKVEGCQEPYGLKITEESPTYVDVEWQQVGSVSSWEVIVVPYGGSITGVPIQTIPVMGLPKVRINGLPTGEVYSIYVRAICSTGEAKSQWGTALDYGATVVNNDLCSGAIIIPVNNGKECIQWASGTLKGMNSEAANASPDCSAGLQMDTWFVFTATKKTHYLEISDWKSPSGAVYPTIMGAIYDQPCSTMDYKSAMECFNIMFTPTGKGKVFSNLIPGQKYYIRLGLRNNSKSDHIFKLCLTSMDYLAVSPMGTDYSAEELVKDVLIRSNCDLVSNVKYQVGDGGTVASTVNTLGYFNRNNTDFPFEDGVVLSTSQVEFVPGPYTTNDKGSNTNRWAGDKEINDAINDAGGGPLLSKRVTQLMFDFTPLKDSIKFDYLFASNSYVIGCTYSCQNGALFAAWLIDSETGEGVNLAKIKDTNTPISLYTIWDNKKITGSGCNSFPDYFWNSYAYTADPFSAPINFAGSTVGMSSETVSVVPGRQYHIRLAVIDFCPSDSHSSAVFFNAGSFDLGELDLGEDLTVENGTALCSSETRIIKSGVKLSPELKSEIEWTKDGEIIVGANSPDIEVSESGEYTMIVKYLDLKCESRGTVIVEIFPPISEVVNQAGKLTFCRFSLEKQYLDLTTVEQKMFKDVLRTDYAVGYFGSKADAESGSNPIDTNYQLGNEDQDIVIYIRVEDLRTNCSQVFELLLAPEEGEIPIGVEDTVVCMEYVFPATLENQFYYSESGGNGIKYKEGDVLKTVGDNLIYLLQLNNESGCYEETSFTVSITAPVVADVFESRVLTCELHVLAPLSENNRYFLEAGGRGIELQPGTIRNKEETIYVYASSPDGLCVDESSYTIDYEECPIQKGISPNGDGINDKFDLSLHGVQSLKIYNRYGYEVFSYGNGYTNQWVGQDKSENGLPDGTYYYVVRANDKERTGWVQINR